MHTHTPTWVCLNMRCPFLVPKRLLYEEKRTPHFETPLHTHIYMCVICVKNHVLQQWIASWGAKPTQDKTTVHNT